MDYMGRCQNYGRFLGTLNIRGRVIIGVQNGLTTTHIGFIGHIEYISGLYRDNGQENSTLNPKP